MALDLDLVRPTTPCAPHIVPLSPIDQIMVRVYVTCIFCFPLPLGTDHQTLCSRLKGGLSLTLSEIPFIGGCIVPEEGDRGRLQILVGEGYGIRFSYRDYTDGSSQKLWPKSYNELKAAQFPISALDAGKLSPLDMVPTSPTPAVMAVQANFINGGLLLTTCIHHSASDGTGLATVLKVWAEHSRRENVADGLPSPIALRWKEMDRSTLKHGQAGADIKDFPEFRVRDGTKVPVLDRVGASSTCPVKDHCIFYFSPSHLAQLKLAASATNPAEPWVSTNDALCALLWRHISRARGLGSAESGKQNMTPVQFTCAVQARRRFSPPLPDDFLGNCVTWCPATLDVDALTSPSSPLYKVAITLRTAITRLDSARLWGVIGAIDAIPDTTNLEVTSYDNPGRSLVVSSWADMGLYGVDWGQGIGRPEYVRITAQPTTGGVGAALIFPRLLDGGLEVVIGVEVETMRRLRADQEFMRFAEWRCS